MSRKYGRDDRLERRRSERRPWGTQVTIVWHDGAAWQTGQVLAQNVSRHGLCFFASAFPGAGRALRIRFEELSGRPEVAGVVRYHQPLAWTFHRVGVEFVDPEAA